MTQVVAELERIKRNEQIAAWTKNEAEIATQVAKKLELEIARQGKLPQTISEASYLDNLTWQAFVDYCTRHNIRHLPAKPHSVASFLLDDRQLSHDRMLEILTVIARAHDQHSLSNPTATAIVRAVIEMVMEDKQPRSFSKDEKEIFAALPADLRFALSRLERRREIDFHRQHERQVKLTKELEAKGSAEIKEETSAAKSNGNAGDENTIAAS